MWPARRLPQHSGHIPGAIWPPPAGRETNRPASPAKRKGPEEWLSPRGMTELNPDLLDLSQDTLANVAGQLTSTHRYLLTAELVALFWETYTELVERRAHVLKWAAEKKARDAAWESTGRALWREARHLLELGLAKPYATGVIHDYYAFEGGTVALRTLLENGDIADVPGIWQ